MIKSVNPFSRKYLEAIKSSEKKLSRIIGLYLLKESKNSEQKIFSVINMVIRIEAVALVIGYITALLINLDYMRFFAIYYFVNLIIVIIIVILKHNRTCT